MVSTSDHPRRKLWKGLQIAGFLVLCWAVGSYIFSKHDPAAAWPFLFVGGALLYAAGRVGAWWSKS